MSRQVGSRYTLQEMIGRGGFGTVWRADGPEGQVAVKVLRAELAEDPEVVSRFVRERSVLLRVRHPNLVRLRDMVVEGEVLALVMDLVEGPTLRAHLDLRGPLPPANAAGLVADLAAALAAVHEAGVVHRDVKPANVLLADAGTNPVPLLTDFGVAGLVEGSALTNAQALIGTPGYLAPEVIRGEPVTSAVDVYACGVLVHELVTGRTPFPADHPLAVLLRQANEDVVRPAELPDPLWTAVAGCLSRAADARPTAAELAERLRALAGSDRALAGGGSTLAGGGVGDGRATVVVNGPSPTTRLMARQQIPQETGQPAPAPPRRAVLWPLIMLTALTVLGTATGGVVGYLLGRDSVPPASSSPTSSYLDQMPVSQIDNAQGPVGLGRAVGGEEPDDGPPLTLDGRVYERGFGTQAPSHLRAYPNGACTKFLATVGIDAEAAAQEGGSVVFQVMLDDKVVYHSGTRTAEDPPIPVELDITGGRILDLMVLDAGDGNDLDHADWADARLICTP